MALIVDVLGAVLAYLKADADVTAQVGTHVYGAELPGSVTLDGNGMPPKSVVVQPSAGGFGQYSRTWVPMANERYDIRCYAPTPKAAMDVWRAVFPAMQLRLKKHVRGGVLLFDATSTIGVSLLREPDTRWPFAFGSFNVLAALEAVPA